MSHLESNEKTAPNRDVILNIRARSAQRDLIDQAADILGTTRTDFMLAAACREAEQVLLDRRVFALSGEEFERFSALLDTPTPDCSRLRDLLKEKAPWDA